MSSVFLDLMSDSSNSFSSSSSSSDKAETSLESVLRLRNADIGKVFTRRKAVVDSLQQIPMELQRIIADYDEPWPVPQSSPGYKYHGPSELYQTYMIVRKMEYKKKAQSAEWLHFEPGTQIQYSHHAQPPCDGIVVHPMVDLLAAQSHANFLLAFIPASRKLELVPPATVISSGEKKEIDQAQLADACKEYEQKQATARKSEPSTLFSAGLSHIITRLHSLSEREKAADANGESVVVNESDANDANENESDRDETKEETKRPVRTRRGGRQRRGARQRSARSGRRSRAKSSSRSRSKSQTKRGNPRGRRRPGGRGRPPQTRSKRKTVDAPSAREESDRGKSPLLPNSEETKISSSASSPTDDSASSTRSHKHHCPCVTTDSSTPASNGSCSTSSASSAFASPLASAQQLSVPMTYSYPYAMMPAPMPTPAPMSYSYPYAMMPTPVPMPSPIPVSPMYPYVQPQMLQPAVPAVQQNPSSSATSDSVNTARHFHECSKKHI